MPRLNLMTMRRGDGFDRGGIRRAGGMAAVAAIAIGPALGAAGLLQAPSDPSPAQGDAVVAAQGVAALGEGDLAWRVVLRAAAPPANAAAIDAENGFLLAAEGALLIEDEATDRQTRLAAGEAVLTRTDDEQVRAALGANAADYYAIELVGSDQAEDAGDGTLLFGGDGFPGPNANHDLDLVRDLLGPGESTALPVGALPTLVLATVGAVDVTAEDGTVLRLAAGEAAAFDGALAVTGAEEGGTFVAGFVGPAVPALGAVAGGAATPIAAAETTAAVASPDDPAITVLDPDAVETGPVEGPTGADDAAAADVAAAEAAAADDAVDTDGDGLTDAAEADLGTDAAVLDSDGDGLVDGDEVNLYETTPLVFDTDGDGTGDGDELVAGTDPLVVDAVVAEEPAAEVPVEPAAPAAPVGVEGDSDGDGASDELELAVGTDPADIDTDDDDATDGDEYNIYATGPLNPDTDADGILDGVEVAQGTDPNDPTSGP